MKLTLNIAAQADARQVELDVDKLVDDLVSSNINGTFAAIERPLVEAVADAILKAAFSLLNQQIGVK